MCGYDELPSEWCKKMILKSKSDEDAVNYTRLMNMWREREGKKNVHP